MYATAFVASAAAIGRRLLFAAETRVWTSGGNLYAAWTQPYRQARLLGGFKPARAAALNLSNICSGFAAAGLVPFDPERVLSRLQLKLRIPTPPASETAIAARQTSKTPYTVAQLAQEYTTIKGLLKRRSKSPPSPTERALKRVVKGCRMAMHNAALLASEIKDLRAMSTRQKRKRETPRSYIASGGVLTAEEEQDRVKRARVANNTVLSGVTRQASGRARLKCSMCSLLKHNARVCPIRVA